jgi:phospholipase D1/2
MRDAGLLNHRTGTGSNASVDSGQSGDLLVPGKTCWRLAHASRVSFLIDAAAYFSAFKAAALRARRSIIIIGWDIDSRVRLEPDRDDVPAPDRLGDFLDHLLVNRPGLHVHILAWDFPLIYAGDRELFTGYRLGLMTNRRLRYCLDSVHPLGASHHQKIVVIDDALAFVGGIDFAARRWDTPRHQLDDPRRIDTSGRRYPPFHDMQIALDGDAAAAMGELARERWHRATGKKITRVRNAGEAWPEGVNVDMSDVGVAIARTDPGVDSVVLTREVEALYLAAISAARRYIYIENQYLTAGAVGEALRESLEREDGPEIVIVLPQESWDWLEQAAMDTRRTALTRRLRQADTHDRLRVFCPLVSGVSIHVHAKVMIFDDRFIRVGSANLANRSMGLDTECDVAIETDRPEPVRSVLSRLVGEHLDHLPDAVAASLVEEGSLIRTIERMRGNEKTLRPINVSDAGDPSGLAQSSQPLFDPEQPAEAESIVGRLVRAVDGRVIARRLALAGVVIGLVVALALAWQTEPLSEWVNAERVVAWWKTYGDSPMAGVVATATFMVAGLALVPLTLLITAAAIAFGPVLGTAYAMIGALLSAAVVYAAGAILGQSWARRLLGPRWRRVGDTLSGRGVLAIALVRMVPVAPYSVVNFLAGALRLRFVDFGLGTALGLIPGVVALSILGGQIGAVLRQPDWFNISLLIAFSVALLVALGLGARTLYRRQGRRRRRSSPG